MKPNIFLRESVFYNVEPLIVNGLKLNQHNFSLNGKKTLKLMQCDTTALKPHLLEGYSYESGQSFYSCKLTLTKKNEGRVYCRAVALV